MKHFTIKELCASTTAKAHGIDNTPSVEIKENIRALIENILDPVREAWKGPVYVSSGYRCPKLNSLVGGSANSHHQKGLAADIYVRATLNMSAESATRSLFNTIKSMPDLPFCQLIYEINPKTGSKWVHISFEPGKTPRREIIDGLIKK